MDQIHEVVSDEVDSWQIESNYTHSNLDTVSDGYSSDEDTSINFFLDFDDIIGKEIVISSYLLPKSLYLFKISEVDTIETLIKFVKINLDYNHHYQRLAFLFPNSIFPLDIGDVVTLKPGASLIVLPKSISKITIVIAEENVVFEVEADLSYHVFTVKQMIEAEYGFPVLQQDLIFEELCLENQQRLYQCDIRSQSVLNLHLQYQYNVVIKVKTFWKTEFDLFVDPCMLVSHVLETVLKRCVSSEIYKDNETMKWDFLLPRHVLLVVGKGGRTLSPDSTLGSYNIQDGDQLLLTTIGRHHKINLNTIEVSLNDGRAARVVVSQFDTWSVIAFHIHGITGQKLNQIKVYANNSQVELGASVGSSRNSLFNIEVNIPEKVKGRRRQILPPPQISVTVYLGSNVTETITCGPEKTVAFINEELEYRGIPNANHYTLLTKFSSLPDSALLKNIVRGTDLKLNVTLKLETFPLSYQCGNDSFKVLYIHPNQTIQRVTEKIHRKTASSPESHKILLCGLQLSDSPILSVYDSEIAIGTTLYLVSNDNLIFLVHSDTQFTKLDIPQSITASQVKDTIWHSENLPSSSLLSMETFLKWYLSLGNTINKGPSNKRVTKKQQTVAGQRLSIIPNLSPDLKQGSHGKTKIPDLPILNPKQSVVLPTKNFTDGNGLSRPTAARSQRKMASVQNPSGILATCEDRRGQILTQYAKEYNQKSEEAINVLSTIHNPSALPSLSGQSVLSSNKDLTKIQANFIPVLNFPSTQPEPWSYLT